MVISEPIYLWGCLVVPVALYGVEAYPWTETDAAPILKIQTEAWRRMLQVGGRAQADAVQVCLGIECMSLIWRVRRLALMLRLINAPHGSLEQLAIVALKTFDTEWYREALDDLHLVAPGRHVIVSRRLAHWTVYPFERSLD